MVADEDVKTTRFTFGACTGIECSRFKVPTTAGAMMSPTGSVMLKWYGDAVWIMNSRVDEWVERAWSKAPGCTMSGTTA